RLFSYLYQSRSLVLPNLVLVLSCNIKTTIGDIYLFIQRRRSSSLLEGEPAVNDDVVGRLVRRILLRWHPVRGCPQSNPVFRFPTWLLVCPARRYLWLPAADPGLCAEDEQT